jgi:site-specific DNA-methyltransferase (adenine-specific)/modification methylase
VRVEKIGECTLYLADCREVLPTLPKVDAVLTDPPYGIGEAAGKNKSRGNMAVAKDYGNDEWDNQAISADLLHMVMAAGRHNIIFGGNYYPMPATSCWLVWDKLNGDNDFADCELAWTNLPKAVRRLRYMWNGMLRANGEERGDHPTQKPLGVMAWCLQQLPSDTRTVLDPFMGSGTTGVACVAAGMAFTGIERETRYFDAACRRIEEAYKQPRLFAEPVAKPTQPDIFAEGKAA